MLYENKYLNELDMEKFVHMLDDTTECYKFYWFDAIISNMLEGKSEIKFEDIIDTMIADAWYSVSEYHLHLGLKDSSGKIMNSLERAINKLIKHTDMESSASKEHIIREIRKNKLLLKEEKYQISKMVPYRLLSPFLVDIDGNNKVWDSQKRAIAYIQKINKNNTLPYIIEDAVSLDKKVIINEQWKEMMLDNVVLLRGWIKLKKIKYLQDRNPNVPGIIYKLEPENISVRKLSHVRKLWRAIMDVTPIRDIYTGELLSATNYAIDHFIPWSYIANDEIWNLTPMDSRLNSSKGNKLPLWDENFPKFARSQFEMYQSIKHSEKLTKLFNDCRRDNLVSTWADEELYRYENSEEMFSKVLEKHMRYIYDSAHTQGYKLWET